MTDIISASNITVTRDNKDILDNVSISVNSDDFITILGPNGAGKSMLLKCLMGFYKPEKGIGGLTVRLNDIDFNGTGVPFVPFVPGKYSGK